MLNIYKKYFNIDEEGGFMILPQICKYLAYTKDK